MAHIALTVRKIKPGKVDEFLERFGAPDDAPEGWRSFYAVRSVQDENELITFGYFDGTLDELNASQGEQYEEMRAATDELVESVGASGIYEVVREVNR